MIILKSEREIELIRESGRICARAFQSAEKLIKPGVELKHIEGRIADFILRSGATPAFKGYRGFPGAVCISVNDGVVHGIPDERVLMGGDIVSIDIGVSKSGYYSDAAKTFPVGNISSAAEKLIKVTEEALYKGIVRAVEGNRLSDISWAIQSHVEKHGFSVVRELAGHGIGSALHEAPNIPNFGPAGTGPVLREGMVFAIEPMVNAGSPETVTLPDGWTVKSRDGSLSAHFEHTVWVRKEEPLILTLP
ncbi:methionine aminopeptidase [candidate division TA06 bacterium DG_26]|uniref:Methionine aminopeptidase n=1 Tax=candidate division TA06 bacterium DG_26 TaxID=1703771 RepID=A0A0S7WEU1_UNCT6|nr:MAG: methionine aminopeptidase [candidate division TA06 bacterium DG_26]